jgi:DNA replication protein DnaC
VTKIRYKKASAIFCSQFDIGDWHTQIGETTMADAVVDRIVHDYYKFVIEGKESMRKRKGIRADE